MNNTDKRRAAAPSAAVAMPRGTNEDQDSGVSSLEFSASEKDDDDAGASGDSDAELLGVVKPGAEQRSGLDDRAEEPPASENADTIVWRKPQNKSRVCRRSSSRAWRQGRKGVSAPLRAARNRW